MTCIGREEVNVWVIVLIWMLIGRFLADEEVVWGERSDGCCDIRSVKIRSVVCTISWCRVDGVDEAHHGVSVVVVNEFSIDR